MSLSTLAAAATVATTIFGGHTSQYAPVGVDVTAGGRTMSQFALQVDLRCDDGTGASWAGHAASPARISRRGSFRATGVGRSRYGVDKLGTVTERIRGTVRRGVARGTYSSTLVMTDETTGATVRTCRSGAVTWRARSAPGRIYAGEFDSGLPLVLERTQDGRRLRVLWVAWSAACQHGGGYEVGEGLSNFAIARNGRFGDRWSDEEDGGARVFEYSLDGSVGAGRASGTFGVSVTEKDAAGATTDTCTSPPDRWTARSTRGAKVRRPKTEVRAGG
jgi:hypothetical protein